MEYEGYVFPDDLKYEKNHFWARVEGDLVVMGATEFISKQAGEITYVGLPEPDDCAQSKPIGSIESGKWVGRIYAVVSGAVAEVNEALEDEPEKINEDPYGEGWICKIKPSDLTVELARRMAPDASFTKFLVDELKKIEEQKK